MIEKKSFILWSLMVGYLCCILVGQSIQQLDDPCASNPCNRTSKCVQDGKGNYTCQCNYMFNKENCLNESLADGLCTLLKPCLNNGTCVDYNYVDYYYCFCYGNYYGQRCEFYSRVCEKQPCLNGGVCYGNGADGYYCSCFYPYYGTNCTNVHNETSTSLPSNSTLPPDDPCASSPCQHGGICQPHVRSYKCICSSDRTGSNCEALIDDKKQPPSKVSFSFFFSLFNLFNTINH